MSDMNFEGVRTDNIFTDGEYIFTIETGEWKKTKDGLSEYLNLMFRESVTKQCVFKMFNLLNKNDIAKNIALQDMKKLYIAIYGNADDLKTISKIELLTKLLNQVIKGTTCIKAGNGSYPDSNDIKKYAQYIPAEKAVELPF